MRQPIERLFVFGILSVMLSGCGGGPGEQTGRLSLTVRWPERSRLIPVASNSIRATLTRGDQTLGTQLLPRPTTGNETSVTFTDLAPGSVTLTATALPVADGSGVAQATGAAPATIVAGQTAQVTVTMASTIDHLEITPANPSVPVGQTVQLTMTARNAAGEVVLTSPSTVQWSSGSTANATVNSTGLVSGVAAGTAQITVTETESNQSASTDVTVTGPLPNNRGIFIADPQRNRVIRVDDMTGANWTEFSGAVGASMPGYASVGSDGRVYMTFSYRAARTDDFATGAGLVTYGSYGEDGAPGHFVRNEGILLGPDNRIYILAYWNHRIVRIDDMTGAGWTAFGSEGSGVGQFNSPLGFWITPNGQIYVADTSNNRIVRIDDMTGAGWTTFGTVGTGVGQFLAPASVAVDTQGRIYVADGANARIVRIDDMTGAGWTTFGSEGSGVGQFGTNFRGIFVDSQNRIYIADTLNARIVRIDDMTGAGWTTFGTFGTGVGQFLAPASVFVR